MKKIFLIAFLLLNYSVLYAQETSGNYDAKHELSIVIDDIFAKNQCINYPAWIYNNIPRYYPSYMDYGEQSITTAGLGYKFHLKKSAIRSKYSIGYNEYEVDNVTDSIINNSTIFSSVVFLGFEFNHTFEKAQFFFGVDLFYRYLKSIQKNKNIRTNTSFNSKHTKNFSSMGFSPLIGVKYFISKNISISSELKYFIESYQEDSAYKYENESDNSESKSKKSGIYTSFGPLGQISLNIHF